MTKHFRFLNLVLLLGLLVLCCSLEPVAPINGKEIKLLRPIQLKYVQMPREERIAYFANEASRKELKSQGFYPASTTLSWKDDAPEGTQYTVTLSTSPNFDRKDDIKTTTDKKSAKFYNLMIATTYYWKVEKQGETSQTATFKTADIAPRLLRVPGIWNVRDLGGRIGLDGRRVRQNMIFRTGGLNNNATSVYYTFEELLNNPKYKDQAEAAIAREKRFTDIKNPVLVPFALTQNWTVFQPQIAKFSSDDLKALDALNDAIPQTLLNTHAKEVSADTSWCVKLPLVAEYKPMVLMQTFDAPADGLMPFACGADWFWQLRLNGELIFDFNNGNDKITDRYNYTLLLPVKKGKNLLCVNVGSGSAGWSWSCGPAKQTETDAEKALAKTIKTLKKTQAEQLKIRKELLPGKVLLSEESKNYMLNVMGIKTDIDLRSDSECFGMTGSPLGPTVRWVHISSSSYQGMVGKSGRAAFKKVFKVFLDEENYPIDFHCIAGQDRTGAVAFILNALLGVSEEELFLDWECTGFWNRDLGFTHAKRFNHLYKAFNKLPGNNMREKVEGYVISLGFTMDDINHFREIMLEPAAK